MRKRKKPAAAAKSPGMVRIIGGQWRSRKLHFSDQPGLRPTPDRIRETLFNWLTPFLPGARCLDLFCGSAVLGFEALSRGAQSALFVDNSSQVQQDWAANAAALQAQDAQFILADAASWLQQGPHSAYDILFVDPPYAKQALNATFTALCTSSILAPAGLIYFEHPRSETVEIPANWALFREKSAGMNRYCLYQNKDNAP